jgi:hypothetical protein
MSDNSQKRTLVNRALLILNAGRTSAARIFFTSIDDNYFSDPFTNVPSTQKDLLAACVAYEPILLMVMEDIIPDFMKKYADLGAAVKVNKESTEWDYLFELPSDYDSRLRNTVRQVDQGNRKKTYDFDILHFESYAHIVDGSDDQTYYCSTDHTSADDSSDGQPPSNDGNSNWTLYDTDTIGATHSVYSYAYKSAQTGDVFASNNYSNNPSATIDDDINSAYIEYIPYTQAGINDKPQYYSEHFKNAFCTRLAAELAIDSKDYERRRLLLEEYERMANPTYRRIQNSKKYIKRHISTFEARNRR